MYSTRGKPPSTSLHPQTKSLRKSSDCDALCLVDEEDCDVEGGPCTPAAPVQPSVGHRDSLPLWHREAASPWIHHGYRLAHNDWATCVQSLFTLHNETLNIWSHLAAFLVWIPLSMQAAWSPEFARLPLMSQAVGVGVLCAGSLLPLFSSVAHTLHPMSPRAYALAWQLDYAGILVGWFARFVFTAWFLLACLPNAAVLSFVLAVGVVLFGGLGPVVVMRKNMRLFGLLYLVLHLPELVWWQLEWLAPGLTPHSFTEPVAAAAAADGISMFMQASMCGVMGVLFYISHVPERWAPGRINYFTSHVIWHLWTGFGPALLCVPGTVHFFRYALLTCPAAPLPTFV